MKVGDLVCWHDKKVWIGMVLEVTRNGNAEACAVRWANGVTSNHSKSYLVALETSENT